MAKLKLTKGELKRQRDSLRQFERYLPTLQLKKQQLQLEIVQQYALRAQRAAAHAAKVKAAHAWAGVLIEAQAQCAAWCTPHTVITETKNVAGVDILLFVRAEFSEAVYDLWETPLWVDGAIEALRQIVSLREELRVLDKGIESLRQELRITAQRVNLFEKVKIPEAKEAIRLIKIYLGDQMANAVGRGKIAKRKIAELEHAEAAV